MAMQLQVDGKNPFRTSYSDPMLFQDAGKMEDRTVQQLSPQQDLGIDVSFYQQDVHDTDFTASFFEHRDVQCISPSALVDISCSRQEEDIATPEGEQDVGQAKIPSPLNLLEGVLDEGLPEEHVDTVFEGSEKDLADQLEGEQDLSRAFSSETLYAVNKRKRKARKCLQKSSQQESQSESGLKEKKNKVEWTKTLVENLVEIVERVADKTKPREHQVDWKEVAAEVSVIAKAVVKHKTCRDAYTRRFNPKLKSLTSDIKKKIETDLKKGEFIKPNGSIFYTELAAHFKVADSKVRTWILLSPELEKNDFFREFRRKEAERLAFYGQIDSEDRQQLKEELLKKESYLEDGAIDYPLLSIKLRKFPDRIVRYIEKHKEEYERYKVQAFLPDAVVDNSGAHLVDHAEALIEGAAQGEGEFSHEDLQVNKGTLKEITIKEKGDSKPFVWNIDMQETLLKSVHKRKALGAVYVNWSLIAENVNELPTKTRKVTPGVCKNIYKQVAISIPHQRIKKGLNCKEIAEKIEQTLKAGKCFSKNNNSIHYVKLQKQSKIRVSYDVLKRIFLYKEEVYGNSSYLKDMRNQELSSQDIKPHEYKPRIPLS